MTSNRLIMLFLLLLSSCSFEYDSNAIWTVRTFAGFLKEFEEPFGLAVDNKGNVYVSDGQKNSIFRVSPKGAVELLTGSLNTPSHIAFDRKGALLVADTGSHTIKRINLDSNQIEIVAGVEGKRGYLDGDSKTALFNAPIGIAVSGDKIFVSDTYNDKIRVIEDGKVKTLAGGVQGYVDGPEAEARFNTPCGIVALSDGSLLVADLLNRAVRKISDGNVTTLIRDLEAPVALAVDSDGVLYIADGDSIKVVKNLSSSEVELLSSDEAGLEDGAARESKFMRPSSISVYGKTVFVADSDNSLVRVITSKPIGKEVSDEEKRYLIGEVKNFSSRWCYEPPERKRDIAGTFGEIRGELKQINDDAWFHNGVDIAGYHGEKAFFMRTEKVLLPSSVFNFADMRESLRLPLSGYVHIKLGRDVKDCPFEDERFQFYFDEQGKLKSLRIARGTVFYEGEPIGTLNQMNHVHLIIGRRSLIQNPFLAVNFPGISDTIQPIIEDIYFVNEFWQPVSLSKPNGRVRVLVRAFDRIDGNPARRKLGLYSIGYRLLEGDSIVFDKFPSIVFDKLPRQKRASLVYAPGSQSGVSLETSFIYIATNHLQDGEIVEDFLDVDSLEPGNYKLQVIVADFFGNRAQKEIVFTKK